MGEIKRTQWAALEAKSYSLCFRVSNLAVSKKFWDITLLIEIMSKEKCVDSKKFFPNESMKKNDYLQWRLVSKTLGIVCETR